MLYLFSFRLMLLITVYSKLITMWSNFDEMSDRICGHGKEIQDVWSVACFFA